MYAVRYAQHRDLDRLQQFFALANITGGQLNGKNSHFLFVEEMNRKKIVGTVGLEVYQTVGMLRLFVIDPSTKNARIGFMLIELMLAYAKNLSLKKIYLITEKGQIFFEKRGFQKTSFGMLPIEVEESTYVKHARTRGIPMVYEF